MDKFRQAEVVVSGLLDSFLSCLDRVIEILVDICRWRIVLPYEKLIPFQGFSWEIRLRMHELLANFSQQPKVEGRIENLTVSEGIFTSKCAKLGAKSSLLLQDIDAFSRLLRLSRIDDSWARLLFLCSPALYSSSSTSKYTALLLALVYVLPQCSSEEFRRVCQIALPVLLQKIYGAGLVNDTLVLMVVDALGQVCLLLLGSRDRRSGLSIFAKKILRAFQDLGAGCSVLVGVSLFQTVCKILKLQPDFALSRDALEVESLFQPFALFSSMMLRTISGISLEGLSMPIRSILQAEIFGLAGCFQASLSDCVSLK